jgi:hypothetical protein
LLAAVAAVAREFYKRHMNHQVDFGLGLVAVAVAVDIELLLVLL